LPSRFRDMGATIGKTFWGEQGLDLVGLLEQLDQICGCPQLKLRQQDPAAARISEMIDTLFRLHDLNENGVLEEEELVQLNKKVAIMHHGKGVDTDQVREKYHALFRNELDATGEPVGVEKFRDYTLRVLRAIDSDASAQQMILEQWIAEAALGRASFAVPSFHSFSDLPFLLARSFSQDPVSASALKCSFGEDASTRAVSEDQSPSERSCRPGSGEIPRAPPASEATSSGKSLLSGVDLLLGIVTTERPSRL